MSKQQKNVPRRPTMLQKNYLEAQRKWDDQYARKIVPIIRKVFITEDLCWEGQFKFDPYCEQCGLLSECPFAIDKTCLQCYIENSAW